MFEIAGGIIIAVIAIWDGAAPQGLGGPLFRGFVLSEFGDRPLADSFFKAGDFPERVDRGGEST